MDPQKFFFPILALGPDGNPEYLRGNAFPVTDDGGLVTCRHVVSVEGETQLAIYDREVGVLRPIESVDLPDDADLDLAFLPRALGRKCKRFPLLPPDKLLMGRNVYTYGLYSPSGRIENLANGYFKGHVVTYRRAGHYMTVSLSYPIIEGLSGSPVLSAYNGVKVVGVCFGSESQRILASEIVDLREGEREYRETVNRIVEFGLSYRADVVEAFMAEAAPDAKLVVTSESFDRDELG